METIVQFLQPGHSFMARGQRHIIRHVFRLGEADGVLVVGERLDQLRPVGATGRYFDANFEWGDTVDVLSDTL